MNQPNKQPELDKTLTDMAQGTAEQAALGTSPYGSIIRIVAFIAIFILAGGTLFYFMGQ